MKMRARNLIPPYRLSRRHRRQRLRAWLIGSGIYAAALVAVALLVHQHTASARDRAGELSAASRDVEQARRAMDLQQRRLNAAMVEQAANRAVSHQPDWSILLAALAGELGDQIVFRSCRLDALDESGAASCDVAIKLSGLGKGQSAVSQFILRLEESGLFDQVKLIRTAREAMGDSTAVAFELECHFGPSQGGKS